MLFSMNLAAIAALAAAGSTYAVPTASSNAGKIQRAKMEEATGNSLRPYTTTLKPVNLQSFESSFGMEKRDMTEMDYIIPDRQAHMVFGSPGARGQMHLANMTMYASEDLPIVMMERFEGLTSSVDCEGDDGILALQFKSQKAYDKAIANWKYINDDTKREFLMITNHDGCGAAEQRQAYRISKVTNKDDTHSVSLSAAPAAWKDVCGTFDLDFGKAGLTDEAVNSLVKRDFDHSIDIPFDHGTPGEEHLLFEDFTTNPPQLKLTCTNCFTNGSFHTTGTVHTELFIPTSVSLEVLPQDIQAVVELKAELGKKTPDSDFAKYELTLFEFPIPGAGIDVPGIFSLGAKIAFNIQGRVLGLGLATIYLGGTLSLDNGARLNMDLVDWENTEATDFNVNWDPEVRLGEASISLIALAGPSPALTLGIDVLESNGLEASLAFGTPTFNINATAGFDESGWCNNTDPVTSGFRVQSAANFDMSLSVTGELGGDEHSLFDRKLVNIPLATFLDKCWDVPGLTPPAWEAESSFRKGIGLAHHRGFHPEE